MEAQTFKASFHCATFHCLQQQRDIAVSINAISRYCNI